MSSNSFAFKKFTIQQEKCAMKVGTDAVLLGAWAKTYGVRHALDIGTGTGVIALMLAQKCGAQIDAIDVDADSCDEAKMNVNVSEWRDRIHVHHISLQEFAKRADEKYELIVSNPPYFNPSTSSGQAQGLAQSEESRTKARHTVLLSFTDLIAGVKKLLAKDGKFYVILPTKEGIQFQELAESNGLHLRRLTRVKTTPAKMEKRLLMQFGFLPKEKLTESELIIEKDNLNAQHYTDEYKELTKEFYVNF